MSERSWARVRLEPAARSRRAMASMRWCAPRRRAAAAVRVSVPVPSGLIRTPRVRAARVWARLVAVSFARRFVLPELPRLLGRHPALAVELSMEDRRVDVVREGFEQTPGPRAGEPLDLEGAP